MRYLEKNGWIFLSEGRSHSLYRNLSNGKVSTIPRHPDIKENLCRKICKDLDIFDIMKS